MAPQVAIISTSNDKLGDHPTGTWAEEVAAPYYTFKDAGFYVTVGSIKGGKIPVDKNSLADNAKTPITKKWLNDEEAQQAFNNSVPLSDIKTREWDAVFLPGGHGVYGDYVNNPEFSQFLGKQYASGRILSAVCHGPAAFTEVTKPDGSPLVMDQNVTGFTDSEERAVGLDKVVPFLLESKLKEKGAKFHAGPDWSSNSIVEGNLITGQNPASSEATAKNVVNALKGST